MSTTKKTSNPMAQWSLLVSLLWSVTNTVLAAEPAFPIAMIGAEVFKGPETDKGHFSVPFGAAQKIRGEVVGEKTMMWIGDRTRTTWKLSRGQSFDAVFDAVEQFVQTQANKQAQYACKSYGCGASAFWVNDLLEMPPLTGLDKTQGVWVWHDKQEIHLLYLMQRGNLEIYLFSQIIKGLPAGS